MVHFHLFLDGHENELVLLAMQLKFFAYQHDASLQGEPELSGSKKLMERVLTEGFLEDKVSGCGAPWLGSKLTWRSCSWGIPPGG